MSRSVIDPSGRKLVIHPVTDEEFSKLAEVVGGVASNAAWMILAAIVASVRSIDGVPVHIPETKEALKALGKAIGTAGIEMVFRTLFPDVLPKFPNRSDA